jgi:hypothetical protein
MCDKKEQHKKKLNVCMNVYVKNIGKVYCLENRIFLMCRNAIGSIVILADGLKIEVYGTFLVALYLSYTFSVD